MKQFLFAVLILLSSSLAATTVNPIVNEETKPINVSESAIVWTGKKVTGQHTGNIMIKSGNLDFDNGALTGGSLTIDMASITCSDLKPKGAKKLEGHLKSDDFFGVPNHPTAQLTFTGVNASKTRGSYEITADLTIKEITKSITFTAVVGGNEATAIIVIDRTDFDVRYGSGSFFDDLGDKTIYDDFKLEVKLKY